MEEEWKKKGPNDGNTTDTGRGGSRNKFDRGNRGNRNKIDNYGSRNETNHANTKTTIGNEHFRSRGGSNSVRGGTRGGYNRVQNNKGVSDSCQTERKFESYVNQSSTSKYGSRSDVNIGNSRTFLKEVTENIRYEASLQWINNKPTENFSVMQSVKEPGTVYGKTIGIQTNNFKISKLELIPSSQVGPGRCIIIQYHVNFEKHKRLQENESKEKQYPNKLLRELMKNLLSKIFNSKSIVASDFIKTFYSLNPIPQNLVGCDIQLALGEKEWIARINESTKIRNVAQLLECIKDQRIWFLQKNVKMPDNLLMMESFINTILKTQLHTRIDVSVYGNSSFYKNIRTRNEPVPLGYGTECWRGFSIVTLLGWKPYVNVDVTHIVVGQSVFDAITSNTQIDPTKASSLTEDMLKNVNEFLRGCKIDYRTGPGQKRSGEIQEVIPRSPTSEKFQENGKEITVAEYFKRKYKIKLDCMDRICLLLKGNSVIPAEICTIRKPAGNTSHQTSQLVKLASKTPIERKRKIDEHMKTIAFNKDNILKHYGITIDSSCHRIDDARVLPTPKLIYDVKNAFINDGVWKLQGSKFLEPANNGQEISWAILDLANLRHKTRDFGNMLVHIGSKLGLNLSPEFMIESCKPVHSYVSKALNLTAEKKLRLAVVIVNSMDENFAKKLYSEIKRSTELISGGMRNSLLSQVVQTSTVLKKANETTITNILLKINTKLGGINYVLTPENVSASKPWNNINILCAPVLIIGADVTHPSPGSNSNVPSFAAVTGSYDRTGMPYQMRITAQKKANKGAAEIIQGLKNAVVDFILTFIKETGHKPRKILYYRDGVGDSQFDEVLNVKMMAIRQACEHVSRRDDFNDICVNDRALGEVIDPGNYHPPITFVVVQKRHKVRFFVQNEADGVGKGRNAPPGTVVDCDIVKVTNTDFYLLSNAGIQGTSKPTRYQVIWDDSNFTSDELQLLTYYLCYMCVRCMRSISYPAPTYYAHLGAARAKDYTFGWSESEFNDLERLNTKLQRNPDFMEAFKMHFV